MSGASWKLFQGDGAEWDSLLDRFVDATVYQSHGWGEHKGDMGWQRLRLTAQVAGRVVAMAQVLYRAFPLGTALAWIPGGPIGECAAWNAGLRAAITDGVGASKVYCRLNALREESAADLGELASAGWVHAASRMVSGESLLLDLSAAHEEWLESIDGKHRYYVRKSAREAIRWSSGNTADLRRDLASLTMRLSKEKSMHLQERGEQDLESLALRLPRGMHLMIGYLEDQPVSGCMVLAHGSKGFYATAATVGRGRELSAAYCMIAEVRRGLRERGLTHLDFGGINPASPSARGVDHFKRGFGGRAIRYLGEWDWARPPLLRRGANFLIARRGRGF